MITHVPAAITVTADLTNHAPVPDFTGELTATDSVGVTHITQDLPAGTVVGVGNYTITFTIEDAAHNTATCRTTLTVEDGPALPGRYAALLADAQGAIHALAELKLTRGRFPHWLPAARGWTARAAPRHSIVRQQPTPLPLR
jgi:hypothetical protein